MSSLIEIINSKISDKSKLGDWYSDRLKVCMLCEYNSENKKVLTFSEKAIVAVNLGKASCLACGCEIAAKASVQTEDCGAVKKLEKSKWLKINLENEDKFSVICKNENVKLSYIGGSHYEIDYGKIPYNLDSTVNLHIFKKGLDIKKINATASCGCTGTEASYNDKNEINFKIKYDTLRVGIFEKNTSLTIRDKSGKMYNVFVNIKGEVYEL